MSAPERPPAALATLSDKELEILRLLTAGHTIKSIAALLGRSEASINERLREARRKTGVGSSRELARLVDAHKDSARPGAPQENRDDFPDLPAPGHPAHDDAAAPATGRASSKGMLAMLLALTVAAAGLLAATVDRAGPAASSPLPTASSLQHERALAAATPRALPLAGRWSLDVARIPADERPRQVTMAFHPAGEQTWTTVVDIVTPDGSTQHAESTAALDGVPVPIHGNMAFIDSVSLRQPAPNTLVMTLGKNGTPVSTRVYAVAKDGRTMTETIVWAGTAMPRLETTTFHRLD
ncbi:MULTISPECIES: helix-turn-helix transcriptional regulator [unclassified Novosphingobium]|uniref:helix-turn-helix domain-containing protein n=1 Tax=unclassified Novosphingobium TaxID=2644732 RepID=UPI00146ADFCB|nr:MULTISPECIES: helix-turn-helix transcriptional regulator [unclassified Novosphingobium]NMN03406.1 DNA-binding CsgD family transcriptional regulator [Novosphingobium sp. SG919]NMN86604.1 DNA-binding CsgD family transcriptional regulator [Novosphingobium sp. SG916]